MSSVRLRHPSLANINFTVVHYRRYTEPLLCAACGTVHTHKTYHLRLDSQGEVVVSDVIAERLAELNGLPLRRVGMEPHPQPMILAVPPAGANGSAQLPIPTATFIPKKMREAM